MILAELNIRHTRRHQPTRRVALGDHYLPTSGPAYGAVLLGAVVSENLGGLDDEQRDLLPRLLFPVGGLRKGGGGVVGQVGDKAGEAFAEPLVGQRGVQQFLFRPGGVHTG